MKIYTFSPVITCTGPNKNSESCEVPCHVPYSAKKDIEIEMSESDIILVSNTGISPVDMDLETQIVTAHPVTEYRDEQHFKL